MSSDDIAGTASAGSVESRRMAVDPETGFARYSPEGCGLSIALPSEPVAVDVPTPESDKEVIGYARNYLAKSDGYAVTITHVRFASESSTITDGTVDDFIQGLVESLSSAPGRSGFKYEVTEKKATHVSLRGSYNRAGVVFGFEASIEIQGKHVWVVSVLRALSDNSRVEASRKVLASARLDGPPCTD